MMAAGGNLGQRDQLVSARRYVARSVKRQHYLLLVQSSKEIGGEQSVKLEVIVAKGCSLVGQLKQTRRAGI